MNAINLFNATIKRSRQLVVLLDALSSEQKQRMDSPEDLLRSATSLAVAAMDTYFTDRFSESVVAFLKKKGPTPGLVKVLGDAGLNTKTALEMLTMERPYRRIRTLVETHLSGFTTQRQHVIDELFSVYAVKDLSKHAQGIAQRQTLLVRVNDFVVRRHGIVHEGDYNAHSKLNKIDAKYVSKHIDDIELYVTSAEKLLMKSMKI